MLPAIKIEPSIDQRIELSRQLLAVDAMTEQQAKELLKQALSIMLARENVIKGLMER